jgi:hypothetical protein
MLWYLKVHQGSMITVDVYLGTLGLYCKLNDKKLEMLIKDAIN